MAVLLGLVTAEFSELSPWLAQKLIRWAARVRYPTRVEELSALIADRPGKLFKLVTASGFVCAALAYRITHRKATPARSVTTRLGIGFLSALVSGALLASEMILAFAIDDFLTDYHTISFYVSWEMFVFYGTIAAFATAAEFFTSCRLPTGWATATAVIASAALALIYAGVSHSAERLDEDMIIGGGMAVTVGIGAACVIQLGNRSRFPFVAVLWTILGGGLLTFAGWASPSAVFVPSLGFALGFSAGVGVLLGQVLDGRRQSFGGRRPSSNRAGQISAEDG
ncbi:MAG TPA: hypothetical protein VFO16_07135 [Pseudonocardiaceae bacterium]|nr:hypothetical protein [Pseudonocardiaceae bacterium]